MTSNCFSFSPCFAFSVAPLQNTDFEAEYKFSNDPKFICFSQLSMSAKSPNIFQPIKKAPQSQVKFVPREVKEKSNEIDQ
jgi:hypothetical protein